MRPPLGIPLGLALALAPAVARAEPPVAARLDYTRGPGAETCPAEPSALRAQVAALLGYDPFERSDARERFVVVISREKDHAWSARVERYDAAGARTYGPETFPDPPLQGDCEALFSPLAASLRGLVLRAGPPPASPTPSPAPAPPEPSKPPEPAPPDVPNPARVVATRVAIVSYALTGVFLGLAIGWTVDEQSKRNAALTLAAQPNPAGGIGDSACYSGSPAGSYCGRLLSAWQAHDTAIGLRNGWYIGAGVSAAVGIAATVWAVNLPATIKGPVQIQVMFRPGGVVLSGTF